MAKIPADGNDNYVSVIEVTTSKYKKILQQCYRLPFGITMLNCLFMIFLLLFLSGRSNYFEL